MPKKGAKRLSASRSHAPSGGLGSIVGTNLAKQVHSLNAAHRAKSPSTKRSEARDRLNRQLQKKSTLSEKKASLRHYVSKKSLTGSYSRKAHSELKAGTSRGSGWARQPRDPRTGRWI